MPREALVCGLCEKIGLFSSLTQILETGGSKIQSPREKVTENHKWSRREVNLHGILCYTVSAEVPSTSVNLSVPLSNRTISFPTSL